MEFCVYMNRCTIIAPYTLDVQKQTLSAAKSTIEGLGAKFEREASDVNAVWHVYSTDRSGYDFINFVCDTVHSAVSKLNCEVYW